MSTRALLINFFSISVILSVFLFPFFFIDKEIVKRTDFLSYYTGASLLMKGSGNTLYEIPTQSKFQESFFDTREGLLPYKNPPTLALIFVPFTLFSFYSAYKLAVLANVLLLVLVVYLLSKEFTKIKKNYFFLIAVFFLPSLIGIAIGQISLLLLLLSLGIYKSIKGNNPLLTGLLTALLFNKPQYIIFAPFVFLLSRNKKKFLSSFVSTLVILGLTSIILVSWEGILRYPKFLIDTESIFFGSDIYSMMSLNSFIHTINKFFNIPQTWLYLISSGIYLIFFFIFMKYHRNQSLANNFSAATFFTLALAPHAWEFDLVLILLPILFLFSFMFKKRKKSNCIFVAFILFSLYFCWILRFITYPFTISFVLLATGVILLVNPKLKLE